MTDKEWRDAWFRGLALKFWRTPDEWLSFVADGEAQNDSFPHEPVKTERVWRWDCENEQCGKIIHNPPTKPPGTCEGCGGENWRSGGISERPVTVE